MYVTADKIYVFYKSVMDNSTRKTHFRGSEFFSYIRLRRVRLLRSDIVLSHSDIALRAV